MKKHKILVVDDEKAVTDTLGIFLEMEGHEVFSARSGGEATERFAEIEPEIVILDLNMPMMNGFEAAEELKKLSSDVTLIALTGDSREGVWERARTAGFEHQLMKPSSPDEIRELLATITE